MSRMRWSNKRVQANSRYWAILIITVTLYIALTSCQRAISKTSPSFDEWLQTPISMETLAAYKDDSPVTNKKQAVIAATAKLMESRLQPINNPRVVSAEFIRYEDAIIRMRAKESDQYPADKKVWLIKFEGDFEFSPPGGPSEVSFVDAFVMLLPDGGILVTWRKPESSYPYPSQSPDFVNTPPTTSTSIPPTPTPMPTIWRMVATPLNLSSSKTDEIVSILDQLHPTLCIGNGYNILVLTPEPIEMHLPSLKFTETAALPDPNPDSFNERADNIDKSRTAFTGCQPGNCGQLYVTDNKTGKFYEIDFGADTHLTLDWLQWINKDTVTVTQQGHLWIIIAAINVEKQQFEYYGWIPGCPPISTP